MYYLLVKVALHRIFGIIQLNDFVISFERRISAIDSDSTMFSSLTVYHNKPNCCDKPNK